MTRTSALNSVNNWPTSQVRLLGLAEADDHALWHYAQGNGFTLVSQDSDFADMASLFGPPPQVIWLRCGNQPTVHIETLFRNHAQIIASFEHDPTAACLEIY